MATPNEAAKTFRPGNSFLKEPSFRFLVLPTGVEGEKVHLIFTEAKVNSFAQRKKTPELTIHTENDYHTIDDDDDDYNDDDDDDDDDGDDDDDDDDNNITFLATTIICSLSALNIRKQG
ncbi:hypothetical protein P5673_033229 [Acropora cervicornis]|uniref:Uncharacterized protein n=1 Tax=Acropora cervicornis TaxID=6130 RepID=A0AAD9PQG9_ACRCE|nr:hypothetical protein P5673_033229 [Acropora cervicornis]